MSDVVPAPASRPDADTACVCRIRDVWKAFDATVVFRGLDLVLRRGETLAILGPSGCGKSVLLKMMIGLVPIDRGSIAFDGVELGAMDAAALRALRQRVGIARTIADRPEVMLYDEPTTGLDPINSSHIAHLIARLQKQLRVTSVIFTHDLSLAFAVADRIGMTRDDRLAALGSVAAIRASTDPDVQDFIQGRARGDEPERVASLAPSDPHARP